MTDANNKHSDKPLEKMTVKQLREIAKDIPDVTGVHAMKKEELLVAINVVQGAGDMAPAPAKASGAAKKTAGIKKEKTALTVKEMKALIKGLKTKRRQAQSEKDNKMTEIYRRRISRLKKQTRNVA
jgi:hypothetical protein